MLRLTPHILNSQEMRAMPDDVFTRMQNAAAEENEESRQVGFQERCVKAVLRAANVPFLVGKAKLAAREKYGNDDLGFAWFNEEFPAYPVMLMSQKMRYTGKPRWTELFGAGFAKHPWFKEYVKQIAEFGWNPQLDRCAMFFNAPHADQSATMVLHNQPIQATMVHDPEQRTEPETRIIRPYGNPQVVYVIESVKSFMQTVGTDWATDLCQ